MRLSVTEIIEITGRKRAKAQAAWFAEYLGADVPCDSHGPILTEAAYEALVAKRLGVFPSQEQTAARPRPSVRMVGVKLAT